MNDVMVFGISRSTLLRLVHRDVMWHGFCPLQSLGLLDVLSNCEFRPRVEAESDPEFKQLIPYVLLDHLDVFDDRGALFVGYERGSGGGESRLYNRFSIGFGGHIEDTDLDIAPPYNTGGKALHLYTRYLSAVARELAEELTFSVSPVRPIFEMQGWINDDSDAAGQVHLGVLHLLRLSSPVVASREPDSIVNPRSYTVPQLSRRRHEMETWSRIVFTEFIVPRS